MQIVFLCFMFVLGAIFGSFFCCQARRLRMREEMASAGKHGRVTRLEGDPQKCMCHFWGRKRRGRTRPELSARSVCLHCGKRLKWHDNIPIISWLALRGKCRYCHQKIGFAEIISELTSALALLLIGTTINVESATAIEWLQFIPATIFTLSLIFLAICDGLTGELPVFGLTISAICAIIVIILPLGYSFLVVDSFNWTGFSKGLLQPILSLLLFGGVYLILYLVSRGKWVGDGDWILSGAIGLALGHPFLSLIALFVANFSATLITLPVIKRKKHHQIYFAPFLVLSFVIVYVLTPVLISMI